MDRNILDMIKGSIAQSRAAGEMIRSQARAALQSPPGSKQGPKIVHSPDGSWYYDLGEHTIDDRGFYVYDMQPADAAAWAEFATGMTDYLLAMTEYGDAVTDWTEALMAELYGVEEDDASSEWPSNEAGHERNGRKKRGKSASKLGGLVRPSKKGSI